jgi:OFA family oxalate/formate antiporter-like MFS transporter
MAFSICTFVFPVAMIAAGRLLLQISPAKIVIMAGFCLGTGLLLSSQAQSLQMLYLCFGLLGGIGVGAIYGVVIATCVRWFPDRKGMISGLAIAGFGLGSVIYAPIASRLIAEFGPMTSFAIQGAVTFIGVLMGAPLLKAVPEDYTPSGYVHSGASGAAVMNYSPRQMLSTWQYWFLLFMYVFANATGLMVFGHASPIGQQVAGLTPLQAASVVSILAILNTFGRFAGGTLSDKFGRFPVVISIYILIALAVFSLKFMNTYMLFTCNVGLIAFCFGGVASVFPSIVIEYFGSKFYGINYGLMFIAFGIGGLFGPQLAAWVLQTHNGDYSLAFIILGCLCVLGAAMGFFSRAPWISGNKHPLPT